MKVSSEPNRAYRPITIVLETEEEYQNFLKSLWGNVDLLYYSGSDITAMTRRGTYVSSHQDFKDKLLSSVKAERNDK